ncbi:cell surface glycoprotein CD200 receptor 1 isoform X4 [Dicentrarchus labrax]|uniref:cell surface glycoprotein CD200 receptor 1 isoform X4 n=1 Tax=Dicentrarchus labrax TaxID=13489 RepID=UPI0021F55A10|nr:cell surface glycoprotein CD200 receptor 1 isoform X4 [Dicentrarchus labrax]XP_051259463.1 cell surface glycoprotein CD200 receptor 1 isoform X4 [Dicentrarchus labrax]
MRACRRYSFRLSLRSQVMNKLSLMDRLPYTKLLIFFCFTFVCRGQGTNQNTSANSNTTTPFKYTVDRHTTFKMGSDADLTCSDKTVNETIYVIWKIDLKYKDCEISFSNDGQSLDSCNDGKSLQSTSSDEFYLHIPNFSNDDVGIYKCDTAYKGGGETYKIDVSITVPPTISAWLERKDNMVVAVCKAERGKPAASITWSHMENLTAGEPVIDSKGFFTVESRLEFLEGMNPENLSCVIRHPYWREEQIFVPKHRKAGYDPWLCILIVVPIIVLLTGLLYFAQKKLMLR